MLYVSQSCYLILHRCNPLSVTLKPLCGKSLTPGLTFEYYITYEKHVALKWFALLNRQLNVIRPLTEALQLCILHGNHVRKPNQTKNNSF